MPLSQSQLDSLSFFQRVLLTTDGTVTDLVSLYTGEPIRITKIAQDFVTSNLSLSPELQQLELQQPELLLQREILLSGKDQHFIYAKSYFVMSRMNKKMQQQLLETNTPIGLLWQQARLETFRSIVDQCIEQQPALDQYFGGQTGQAYLSRSYLVYHGGLPLGLITEKFPSGYFLASPGQSY